ncbi:MAG: glycosyltransferase family 39 protein, partial [Planctomycetota bacterium]|nr:glycosyltransferase family 39 protein [Planctomycetota bacterium]
MLKKISDRKIAAILVGLAMGIRVVVYLGSTLCHGDGPRFIQMMDAFAESQFREGLESWGYHPLYPMIGSFFQPMMGSMAAGYWVSIVLGSAAAAPLYFLAKEALGRPAAFFGTLLYAFHRHIVDVQADVVTEGTFMFFLFSALWLGWKTFQSPDWKTTLLAGLASSAAFLTRGEGLIAVVGIPCWLLLSTLRGKAVLRISLAALLLGSAILAATPYLNYARSVAGPWAISAKGTVRESLTNISKGQPVTSEKKEDSWKGWKTLAEKVRRVTYYVLLPLIFLGLLCTRWRWKTLFYASFPILYWTALILASPKIAGASTRYLLPGLALSFPFAIIGIVQILKWIKRPNLLPWAVLLFILLWGGRCLSFKRYED